MSIILHIPIQKFMNIYKTLLKLSNMIDKSITANDITKAYGAIALRMQTTKTNHNKLINLLTKTKNKQEKLDLLREITRLNLEIEQLEGASRTLLSLTSFSRITLLFEE